VSKLGVDAGASRNTFMPPCQRWLLLLLLLLCLQAACACCVPCAADVCVHWLAGTRQELRPGQAAAVCWVYWRVTPAACSSCAGVSADPKCNFYVWLDLEWTARHTRRHVSCGALLLPWCSAGHHVACGVRCRLQYNVSGNVANESNFSGLSRSSLSPLSHVSAGRSN
jgi:hypothetical protein